MNQRKILTLIYNVMAMSMGSRKNILNGRATTASILAARVTFFFSRGAHHLLSPVSFLNFSARLTSRTGLFSSQTHQLGVSRIKRINARIGLRDGEEMQRLHKAAEDQLDPDGPSGECQRCDAGARDPRETYLQSKNASLNPPTIGPKMEPPTEEKTT